MKALHLPLSAILLLFSFAPLLLSSPLPSSIATLAVDLGFEELQRVMSAFYDTRPLLFQQSPEVVVNAITQASFNSSVTCLIAQYPSWRPIPKAERDNYDTKLDLTHKRPSFPTNKKEHKKPSDRARPQTGPIPNRPQQHTLSGSDRDNFEIVYASPASRSFERFTWSQWGATLFRCPISDIHHRTLFSENSGSSRFFVMLVPSEKGTKPTLPSPVDLFSEHWFPISLMPNHPSPPLTTSSSSSAPGEQVSIQEFLDPYVNPEMTSKPSIAICTAPCFGQFPHVREWFEWSKMMGVDRVIFYDYRVEAEDTRRAFDEFEREGMVDRVGYQQGMPDDVIRFASRWGWWFDLPYFDEQPHHPSTLTFSSKKITKNRFLEDHHFMPNPIMPPVTRRMTWGQSATITDCLLRTVGRYRWVFFFDFDELVVPHSFINLHSSSILGNWLHKTVHKYHLQHDQTVATFPNFVPALGVRNYFFCPFDGNCTTKVGKPHSQVVPPDCSLPSVSTAASLYLCGDLGGCSPSQQLAPTYAQKYLKFVSYFSPFRSTRFLKVGRTKHVIDPILVYFPSIHNIKVVSAEVFGPGVDSQDPSSYSPSSSTSHLRPPHSLATLAPHASFLHNRPNLKKWALHLYPSLQTANEREVLLLLQGLNGVLGMSGKRGERLVGESLPGQIERWILLEGEEGDLHHLRKDDVDTCQVWDFSFLNTFGEMLFENVRKHY